MGELGVDGYRFSLAWPRISRGRARRTPRAWRSTTARGRAAGGGIAPAVTLYHWDLPAGAGVLCGPVVCTPPDALQYADIVVVVATGWGL